MTLRLTGPADPSYDETRRALSASAVVPDLRPAVIAEVDDVNDVRAALAYAERLGLTVTSRSGGHSVAFSSLRDGALVVDLSRLDEVEVDPLAGTARVGPGATSLAAALALRGTGLAFPVGHRAGVALGGYLLAGGNGWNHGAWGSAMESVVAADVVLADGRAARLSELSDPEAFAVLRGAGPGFPGIVTAFHLRLWPEPTVWRRLVTVGAHRLGEVAAWADHLAATIAPDVELTVFLAPPRSALHPDLDEPAVTVAATAFASDPGRARALLTPVEESLPDRLHKTMVGPSDIASMVEVETAPRGLGLASQQAWTRADYRTVLPLVVAQMEECPSPWSSVLVSSSSYRRVAPPRTDAAYLPLGTITVAAYSNWLPGARDADNRTWVTTVVDSLREHWTGHYVGEVDLRQTPDRLADCFRDGVLDRVDAVRSRLDPGGRFADYPGRAD